MPKAIRIRPLQPTRLRNESNLISLELRENLPVPSDTDPWPMPIDLPAETVTKQNLKLQNRNIPPALIDEKRATFDGTAVDHQNPE